MQILLTILAIIEIALSTLSCVFTVTGLIKYFKNRKVKDADMNAKAHKYINIGLTFLLLSFIPSIVEFIIGLF